MVASREVVGSPAMKMLGDRAMAMAPTTRWRMPPLIWWRNEFLAELTTMVTRVREVYSEQLTYDMHYHALTARNF